jgi:hypothetical protein
MNEINPQQHQTYKWTTDKDKFAHCQPPDQALLSCRPKPKRRLLLADAGAAQAEASGSSGVAHVTARQHAKPKLNLFKKSLSAFPYAAF